jgi:hypothetical protein
MFGGVDFSWVLGFGGPQDSGEFILQLVSAFNVSLIQMQKLRHSDTLQFLVAPVIWSSYSHKWKQNFSFR